MIAPRVLEEASFIRGWGGGHRVHTSSQCVSSPLMTGELVLQHVYQEAHRVQWDLQVNA